MSSPRIIRLACTECDTDAWDFITIGELATAIQRGWRQVERDQTWEEATSSDSQNVLDWWTHLGYCPECSKIPGLLEPLDAI